MLNLKLFLAAAAAGEPPVDLTPQGPTNIFTAHLRDVLLITGAGAALALILFLYVYITRRDRRSYTDSGARVIYRAERRHRGNGDSDKHKHRRKRRQREEFEHRNPTLGETGGLPPLRMDDPAEPTP